MAVLIAPPAAAMAAERYAAPGGTVATGACDKDHPCEIHRAVNNAAANDEVIITAADYGSTTSPITGTIASTQPGVNVHGEDGKPRPRIFIDTGMQVPGLSLTGAGSKVRHLEIYGQAVSGSKQSALLLDNSEGTDIVARTVAPEGRACVVLDNSLLTNTLCEATATNAKGIATYVIQPGALNNSVLRNVTAIATATGSIGIEAFAGNNTGEDQHLTVTNAIARGCDITCADVSAQAGPGAMGIATITIDHSNFRFEGWPTPGPDRVVDGPGGGNQRFIAVNFVAAGNYHQAAGSPTIDKGANNVLNGPIDFDGDPRSLGQGTDMGADEFVPPPTAVTGEASALTTSTAVLNGTVNPNAVATTYHFEYGTTESYGSSTSETDAGAANTDAAVAASIAGLAPNTTYHFRIVATNRAATIGGADHTFTTNGFPGAGGSLFSLKLTPTVFAAAARGGSVQATARKRRAPIGTTVTFRLGEAATARFKVQRPRPGRRAGGRCVKPTKRNRRAPKCTRYVPLRGSFSVPGGVGENRFRFTGRLRKRKLPPGRYRLVGNVPGGQRAAKFRIVRG
jgi:hypothetical protein